MQQILKIDNMPITLTIIKNDVYDEVAKTTSYTGAKKDEENAYDKIFTTDEDQEMLERFWTECKNNVCEKLKRVLISEVEAAGIYTLDLDVSSFYEPSLTNGVERGLFSYFVMAITAKWYGFTNKEETVSYATDAAAYMEEVCRKIFFKKKPTRPVI